MNGNRYLMESHLLHKRCRICRQLKSLTAFYQREKSKDGYRNECKPCFYLAVKARVTPAKRKPWDIRWAKSEKGKVSLRAAAARQRVKYPEKKKARNAVNNAIADRRLIRQPCQFPGCRFKAEGHHEDYSKPLEVEWLCRKHHWQLHPNH